MSTTTVNVNMTPYGSIKEVPISEFRAQAVNYLEKDDKASVGDIIEGKEHSMSVFKNKEKKVDVKKKDEVKEEKVEELHLESEVQSTNDNDDGDEYITRAEAVALASSTIEKLKAINNDTCCAMEHIIHEEDNPLSFKNGFKFMAGVSAASILAIGAVKAVEFGIKAILASKMSSGSGDSSE